MGCPNGFLEIIDAPRRPIARPKSQGDLELAPRPFRSWREAKGFHRAPYPDDEMVMWPVDGHIKNYDPALIRPVVHT
jgi:hypothetical protein